MMSLERALLVICFILFGLNAAKAGDLLQKNGGRPSKGMKLKSSKVPTSRFTKRARPSHAWTSAKKPRTK